MPSINEFLFFIDMSQLVTLKFEISRDSQGSGEGATFAPLLAKFSKSWNERYTNIIFLLKTIYSQCRL